MKIANPIYDTVFKYLMPDNAICQESFVTAYQMVGDERDGEFHLAVSREFF
uniref:Uncharacterized protein n=1 Tax=Candidatus Kentrum sp. FW TaxID=2126338 RepID=A0A450SRX9_9GAMM|nr:MAG: hypothetical protein BECKFW1821B_GA0114236_103010 [Candidatus Kentron sp. FW]